MLALIAIAFIFYFLFYLSKKQIISLSFGQIGLAFIIKIIAGCAFGYMYLHATSGKDTWEYHQASVIEYQKFNSGLEGFSPLLHINSHSFQLKTFFSSEDSFWKNLSYDLLISLLTIFNLVSKGNYYINVIFYNFVVLLGHYFLFTTLLKSFPTKKNLLFLITFLFPPLIFWVSGIHKDGLVFTFITGTIYFTTRFIFEKKAQWLVPAMLFLLLLILFRSFVGLPLLPFLIAYYFAVNTPKHSVIIYTATLFICVSIFIASSFGLNFINLPNKIAERQKTFMVLKGGSFMAIPTLDGSIKNYVIALPTALNHVFLRPYLAESSSYLQLFSALETYFFLIMFCIGIFKYWNCFYIVKQPLILLLVFFALINYVLIGFTVPFAGAIVRYRVIFEVFLLIPILLIIDTNNLLTAKLKRLRFFGN